jgi:hypothetical protein
MAALRAHGDNAVHRDDHWYCSLSHFVMKLTKNERPFLSFAYYDIPTGVNE